MEYQEYDDIKRVTSTEQPFEVLQFQQFQIQ
jgi:hypothetical protein